MSSPSHAERDRTPTTARVAVCIARYGIDYSPSILNFLRALAEVAQVDLYLRDAHHLRSPVLSDPSVRVVRIRPSVAPATAVRSAVRLARSFAKVLVTGGGAEPPWLGRWSTVDGARRRAPDYDHHVAFDSHGLLLCMDLFPGCHPVYYSLELVLEEDAGPASGFDPARRAEIAELISRERRHASAIAALVIQSPERARLFLADYPVHRPLPVFYLPVTYDAPPHPERDRMIHRRHRLAADGRVALHLGGMNDWFGTIEAATSLAAIDRWHLYLQGNHDPAYLRRFQTEVAAERIRRAIVSRRFYDRLEDLDPVLASSDVGIAWYRDLSANMRTAGRSSGKIAAYLRFGLPVVASDSASTRGAIRDTGCGTCVERPDEVGEAIAAIEPDLESYRDRALEEYRRSYWFERYRDPLQRFVLSGGREAGDLV